jgi:glycosyltransferase involved in cell wall biosynthesis
MLWSKGVEDYVKAAQICRENSGARFVLVGDPDLGNPAPVPTEQLEAWNRTGWVEWWGHRDDIPEVLAQAAILVLPSRYGEGVPQALIEAAAMGIPIVASDLPGCREVVEHGVNGLLVPPGDIRRLVEAILGLLRDPDLRRRMGKQGRELARQQFAVDRIAEQYREVYRVLGLKGPGIAGGEPHR